MDPALTEYARPRRRFTDCFGIRRAFFCRFTNGLT